MTNKEDELIKEVRDFTNQLYLKYSAENILQRMFWQTFVAAGNVARNNDQFRDGFRVSDEHTSRDGYKFRFRFELEIEQPVKQVEDK